VAALVSLLDAKEDLSLQLSAIDRLAQLSDEAVPSALLSAWDQLAPAVRQRALDALLARPAWTEALLAAAEAGKLRLAQLDAARRDRLLSHPAEGIRARAAALLAVSPQADRQALVERYRGEMADTGDAARGLALFKQHCAACHRLGSEGHVVGPDLASLSNKSDEALLVAVLDPNRAVEWHYKVFQAVTKDGRLHSGMVVEEAGGSVTLAGADGQRVVLLRSELEELRETEKSLMPEGLEASLSANDLRDVFDYVQSN
jgi:putative heme-binding domain-containing protein